MDNRPLEFLNDVSSTDSNDVLIVQTCSEWFQPFSVGRDQADLNETKAEGHAQPVMEDSLPAVDRLCRLLNCERLLRVEIAAEDRMQILAGFSEHAGDEQLDRVQLEKRAHQITERLLGWTLQNARGMGASRSWPDRLLRSKMARRSAAARGGSLLSWMILACLSLLAAAVPLPQRITAVGTLQAVQQRPYYAPLDAIVEEVWVDEGEWVEVNQPLMQLASRELDNQLDQLQGELQQASDRIAELQTRRLAMPDLSLQESDRLEGEIQQLETSRRTCEGQLVILQEQQHKLRIAASKSGQVSTWDLRNRFLQRPVTAGQLLVTTFDPEGEWQLQLSIPDDRIGLVSRTILDSSRRDSATPAGSTSVRFSLSSHPDVLLKAELCKIASHATSNSKVNPTERHVLAIAEVDESSLPSKKNGAVVQASIDCGTVPAGWLVIRDAYWALASRIKLLW